MKKLIEILGILILCNIGIHSSNFVYSVFIENISPKSAPAGTSRNITIKFLNGTSTGTVKYFICLGDINEHTVSCSSIRGPVRLINGEATVNDKIDWMIKTPGEYYAVVQAEFSENGTGWTISSKLGYSVLDTSTNESIKNIQIKKVYVTDQTGRQLTNFYPGQRINLFAEVSFSDKQNVIAEWRIFDPSGNLVTTMCRSLRKEIYNSGTITFYWTPEIPQDAIAGQYIYRFQIGEISKQTNFYVMKSPPPVPAPEEKFFRILEPSDNTTLPYGSDLVIHVEYAGIVKWKIIFDSVTELVAYPPQKEIRIPFSPDVLFPGSHWLRIRWYFADGTYETKTLEIKIENVVQNIQVKTNLDDVQSIMLGYPKFFNVEVYANPKIEVLDSTFLIKSGDNQIKVSLKPVKIDPIVFEFVIPSSYISFPELTFRLEVKYKRIDEKTDIFYWEKKILVEKQSLSLYLSLIDWENTSKAVTSDGQQIYLYGWAANSFLFKDLVFTGVSPWDGLTKPEVRKKIYEKLLLEVFTQGEFYVEIKEKGIIEIKENKDLIEIIFSDIELAEEIWGIGRKLGLDTYIFKKAIAPGIVALKFSKSLRNVYVNLSKGWTGASATAITTKAFYIFSTVVTSIQIGFDLNEALNKFLWLENNRDLFLDEISFIQKIAQDPALREACVELASQYREKLGFEVFVEIVLDLVKYKTLLDNAPALRTAAIAGRSNSPSLLIFTVEEVYQITETLKVISMIATFIKNIKIYLENNSPTTNDLIKLQRILLILSYTHFKTIEKIKDPIVSKLAFFIGDLASGGVWSKYFSECEKSARILYDTIRVQESRILSEILAEQNQNSLSVQNLNLRYDRVTKKIFVENYQGRLYICSGNTCFHSENEVCLDEIRQNIGAGHITIYAGNQKFILDIPYTRR